MSHTSILLAGFAFFACQGPAPSDPGSGTPTQAQPSASQTPQAVAAQPEAAQPVAAQPIVAEPEMAKPAAGSIPGAPHNLRLEYRVEPLGSDVRKPRFSFELDDPRRGARQSAYQIVVVSDPAALESGQGALWDSGKVESSDTCQIEYAGPILNSWTRHWWKVRSWDADGKETPWSEPAHWSTGALGPRDWPAPWIADAQPVAKFKPGGRGWCSEFADKEDAYKWVKIDLGKGAKFDTVKLYPAAPEDDPSKPWALFPSRLIVWAGDFPEFDTISRSFNLIDESAFDIKLPERGPVELHTKSRMSMQYMLIGIEKLAHDPKRGYGAAFAEVEVYDLGLLVSTGKQMWASDSREDNGWGLRLLNDGLTESNAPQGDDPLPQPLLRREFNLKAPLARATLYCTALGLHEVHINGKLVTQDVLEPGWTDYKRLAAYDTYDVTSLLAQGPNAIGVQLADGWFAGRVGLTQNFSGGPKRGIYGRKPAFLARLEIVYADNHRDLIVTDGSWKSSLGGPLVSADLIDGEHWDARREIAGWDRPGFDDKAWTPAELIEVSATPTAQSSTPVRVVGELAPVGVKPLGPNRWLFDFGRNVAGWCRLRASAPAGTDLVLRHGEATNPDGSLYTANLRSAKQTDRYTFKGGSEESFEPRFTSHGFRYVEASYEGAQSDAQLAQPQLVAQVVSNAAEVTGRFHAQDPMLTKLWENIGTTLRANIQSVPSDCPQRDERMGWMGDIQVFAPTATYHSDLAPFFTRWLQSVRDGMASRERFTDFSPNPFNPETDFVGAPGWADAGVFLPYLLWQVYGDTRQLEPSVSSAMRWLDFITLHNPDGLWQNERGNDYGDWLNGSQLNAQGWNQQGCEVDKTLFATAFYARSAELTGVMAAVIGQAENADRYLKLSDKVRAAFQQAYLLPDGTIRGETQAGYALALAFELVPKDRVALVQAKLAASVTEQRAGHMTTGIQTTHRMLIELARSGYEELASQLARSKEFPSWGWQIEQGATSIWERWDGVLPGGGFQDPGMNSFNHYAFGAVGEYLMSCVAGIAPDPDPERVGYEHFFIHPRAGVQIPGAGASYHSIRGTIASDWKIEGDEFVLDVTVPANTSATVVIPALSLEAVREGGKSLAEAAPHVVPLDYEAGPPGGAFAGRASLEVQAGKYHFQSRFRAPASK